MLRKAESEHAHRFEELELGAADLVVVLFEAVFAARPGAPIEGRVRDADERPFGRAKDRDHLLGPAAVHLRAGLRLQRLRQRLVQHHLAEGELSEADHSGLN